MLIAAVCALFQLLFSIWTCLHCSALLLSWALLTSIPIAQTMKCAPQRESEGDRAYSERWPSQTVEAFSLRILIELMGCFILTFAKYDSRERNRSLSLTCHPLTPYAHFGCSDKRILNAMLCMRIVCTTFSNAQIIYIKISFHVWLWQVERSLVVRSQCEWVMQVPATWLCMHVHSFTPFSRSVVGETID